VRFSTGCKLPLAALWKNSPNLWKTRELVKPRALCYIIRMPKRTYQPKTRKRAKVHGFRARMATKSGQTVLKRRRNKQRAQIAV